MFEEETAQRGVPAGGGEVERGGGAAGGAVLAGAGGEAGGVGAVGEEEAGGLGEAGAGAGHERGPGVGLRGVGGGVCACVGREMETGTGEGRREETQVDEWKRRGGCGAHVLGGVRGNAGPEESLEGGRGGGVRGAGVVGGRRLPQARGGLGGAEPARGAGGEEEAEGRVVADAEGVEEGVRLGWPRVRGRGGMTQRPGKTSACRTQARPQPCGFSGAAFWQPVARPGGWDIGCGVSERGGCPRAFSEVPQKWPGLLSPGAAWHR